MSAGLGRRVATALSAGGLGRRLAAALAVAAVGGLAALAALPTTSSRSGPVGPGTVEVQAAAARNGSTRLGLPPLGAISATTHRAPVVLEATVERIDLDRLQTVLASPDPQAQLEAEVEDDLGPLLRSLVLRSLLLSAVVGGLAAAVLPGRRVHHLPLGALGGMTLVGALLLSTWRGYDTAGFSQPRFEGSLERAPSVLRAVGRHVDDLDQVRRRVSTLGRELSSLYETLASPAAPASDEVRLLHVSDLHLNPLGLEIVRQLAERFQVQAVLDTGDITSFGYPVEARFAELLVGMPVPYVVVPGNHDSAEVRTALAAVPNVQVLDGTVDLGGVRVLGIPDPTFTADNEVSAAEAAEVKRDQADAVADRVRADRPDVLAVHDPLLAEESLGEVPVVVAGHLHRRAITVKDGTRVLTVGSSGATGLGSFAVEGGRAYEAEVLSFDGGRLTAVDYVSFRGIGGSFRVDRVVIPPPETSEDGGPGPSSSTTSPTSSTTATTGPPAAPAAQAGADRTRAARTTRLPSGSRKKVIHSSSPAGPNVP